MPPPCAGVPRLLLGLFAVFLFISEAAANWLEFVSGQVFSPRRSSLVDQAVGEVVVESNAKRKRANRGSGVMLLFGVK